MTELGFAIGIPLGIALAVVGAIVVWAMLRAATLDGLAPALLPLSLLTLVFGVLYAGDDSGEHAELAALASVGIGALASVVTTHRSHITTTSSHITTTREEPKDALDQGDNPQGE